jgi:hypothetical protein
MRFQEVDANNENITQLIGKIINLSQVVFEELVACHRTGYYSQELSDIQGDLLELETLVHSLEVQELSEQCFIQRHTVRI